MDPHPALRGVPHDSPDRGGTHRAARDQSEVIGLVRHSFVRQAPPDRVHSYHKLGPRKFAEMHQINIRAIVDRLGAKPYIRVESGRYVGWLGDQRYELGSTEAGLPRAIRRMSEFRREMLAEVA